MGLLFTLVDPWYSLDNLFLNYLVWATLIGVIAVVMAVCCAKFLPDGLGPVIGGFFSVKQAKVQDAMTLVEDSVDAVMNDGEGDVDKLADAAKKKNLVDADGANAATSDDIKTGAEAAKKAARTKGKQAPPQSLNEEDVVYLQKLLKKHGPNNRDALVYLASTLALFAVSCYCLHVYPSWWSVIMCGGVVTRGFIIFHDCCHNSFFPSAKDNALCAKVLAAFVCQNAADWTKSHNHHHRHLGRFDISDFSLTVWFSEKEYQAMSLPLRCAYRLIRDPLVLPNLLSWFIFWIFPLVKDTKKTVLTRGCFFFPIWCLLGTKTALLWFLASWVGGLIGIQLFHLQHQCNTPYRVTPAVHSKWDAGMLGSTHLLVPFPLTLVTAAIEFHHIHHASTQVPSYHLAACHREGEMHVKGKGRKGLWDRAGVNKIGAKRAFLSLFHTLFVGDTKHADEDVPGSPAPSFRSFDVYRMLGLEDNTPSPFGVACGAPGGAELLR